jgi:hypothetical protein
VPSHWCLLGRVWSETAWLAPLAQEISVQWPRLESSSRTVQQGATQRSKRRLSIRCLSPLGEILGVGSYDEVIDEAAEGPAAQAAKRGSSPCRRGCETRSLLPRAMRSRLPRSGERPRSFRVGRAEDVQTVVRELVALAQQAVRDSREIYLVVAVVRAMNRRLRQRTWRHSGLRPGCRVSWTG